MKNLLFALLFFAVPPGAEIALAASDSPAEAPVTTPDGVVHLPPYRIVYLPPVFVTDTNEIRWQYLRIPGFEILSCCDDLTTIDFAQRVCWEQGLVDLTVAADLQARSAVPTTLILLSEDMKKKMSQTVADLAQANTRRESHALADAAGVSSLYIPDSIPQIKLWDADSTGIDIVLDDRDDYDRFPLALGSAATFGAAGARGLAGTKPGGAFNGVVFKPEYLDAILSRRAPSPPAWFVEGMLNFRYRDPGDNFYTAPRSMSNPTMVVRTRPAFWLSKDVTAILRENSGIARALLPMRELVTEPPPLRPPEGSPFRQQWIEDLWARQVRPYPHPKPEDAAALILLHGADPGSPWRYDLWKAQATLFIRWAFDPNAPERRLALWKFVSRASAEPATAAMFQECFGMDFAEAGRRLDAYLKRAVNEELELFPANAIEIPQLQTRDPTVAEKARILGDWERKEIEFVKVSHEEYAEVYVHQAEQTLLGAYRRGERDPGLLAAIGLYECTVGDDARARDFLEEAVQDGVLRPRAYTELARIRLSAALARSGSGGKLDAGQVASVLDLLRPLREEQPPQFATYMLAALVWAHAAVAPRPGDLAMLEEGAYYFPDDPRLILSIARVEAQTGRKDALIALFERGLQKVSDPAARKLFTTLLAGLEPPPAAPVPAATVEIPVQPAVGLVTSHAPGNIRVGVVIDMTPEGRKIARPTPGHPAYYFPIYIGYKEMGNLLVQWHRAPPPLDDVRRAMTEALAEQGYRIATRLHPPSLVIVFRWGTLALEALQQLRVRGYSWNSSAEAGGSGSDGRPTVQIGSELHDHVPNGGGGTVMVNQDEMMTIIAGDRWGEWTTGGGDRISEAQDPEQTDFINLSPRYFLLISAMDFPAFTRHKQVLLWRAHVSTNYWGHYLDEVLGPLITASAPLLGRETGRPQIVSAPLGPVGHVIVGTPEVKDYPADQPPP